MVAPISKPQHTEDTVIKDMQQIHDDQKIEAKFK
jgi:hypothetical protein